MTEFQGYAEQSSAQFGQTTSRDQFWLLNCLVTGAPSHSSLPFSAHTLSPQTGRSTLSWAFLALTLTHGAPDLLLRDWVLQAPYSLLVNGEDLCEVNHLPHCTGSIFVCFFIFFCLRHEWIAKITLFFPCRVMRLENHNIAITLILYFPILLGIFCLTKYQLSKRHQLFISSEVYQNSKLNCLKFRTKYLKQIIYLLYIPCLARNPFLLLLQYRKLTRRKKFAQDI